ncbi:MAG: hypothetical protein IJ685_04600 [Selenomonadaceae bacterium]|nr:hypothetical protein [Selenomonadaceae bacterium]
MSRYILREAFQKLAETSGTVVNISAVKVELSEQATSGTGVILFPSRKISFGSPIFAAKAAGESGAAVIGVIRTSAKNTSGNTFYDGDDDTVTDAELEDVFNGMTPGNKDPSDNEVITDAELQNLFNGGN